MEELCEAMDTIAPEPGPRGPHKSGPRPSEARSFAYPPHADVQTRQLRCRYRSPKAWSVGGDRASARLRYQPPQSIAQAVAERLFGQACRHPLSPPPNADRRFSFLG